MSKIIIKCPDCGQQIRIPANKNIKFSCPKCKTSLRHNPAETVDASDLTSDDDDFRPSGITIFLHVIIGAFIGAPLGTALVGAVASIIGSFIGYYHGFWDTLQPFKLLEILLKSVKIIGEGASDLAVKWIPYGAKIGPWITAGLGYNLSHTRWWNMDNDNRDAS